MTRYLLFSAAAVTAPLYAANAHNQSLVGDVTDILDNILNHYDKALRPTNASGGPILVTVDVEVRSMGPISEKDMEFSMDCYFRQLWTDTRLEYKGPLQQLSLNAKFLRQIWRPDTYFRNGKRSYLHSLTVPNILLRISNDGTVRVSQRLTIKTMCPMYLKKFPMDMQACLVELGSMAYSTEDVVYRWAKRPEISGEVELSQYSLRDVIATERNVSAIRDPNETVSILLLYFKLQRQQGYYMLQIYIPCMLTVVMSWVSFWINKEASPARVALGVMTVLTMSTMSLGGRSDLPRVSYSTALDTYIVGCFAFVFFALVEYAVINFAHFLYITNAVAQLRAVTTALITTKECDRSVISSNLVIEEPGTTEEHGHLDGSVLKRQTNFWRCCRALRRRRNSWQLPAADAVNNNENRKANGVLAGIGGGGGGGADADAEKKRKPPPDPDTEVDWIDDVSKILFPVAYLIFNWVYWTAFFYWLGDEIDSIPAIRDKAFHIKPSTPAVNFNTSSIANLTDVIANASAS